MLPRAWQAAVHGVARVGYNLVTEQQHCQAATAPAQKTTWPRALLRYPFWDQHNPIRKQAVGQETFLKRSYQVFRIDFASDSQPGSALPPPR